MSWAWKARMAWYALLATPRALVQIAPVSNQTLKPHPGIRAGCPMHPLIDLWSPHPNTCKAAHLC